MFEGLDLRVGEEEVIFPLICSVSSCFDAGTKRSETCYFFKQPTVNTSLIEVGWRLLKRKSCTTERNDSRERRIVISFWFLWFALWFALWLSRNEIWGWKMWREWRREGLTDDVEIKRLPGCHVVLTASLARVDTRIAALVHRIDSEAPVELYPLARVQRQTASVWHRNQSVHTIVVKHQIALRCHRREHRHCVANFWSIGFRFFFFFFLKRVTDVDLLPNGDGRMCVFFHYCCCCCQCRNIRNEKERQLTFFPRDAVNGITGDGTRKF